MRDKNRKRALGLSAVVVSVTLLAAFSLVGCSGGSGNGFVLGIGLPLTGSNATYGAASMDSEQLAVDYINSHGGILGHPIKVISWDTKADPATGVAGAHQFVSKHVNAVVGFFNSDVTVPAIRILEQANIPLFGDNPSTPKLASLHLTNFIRLTGDDALEGVIQAQFAVQKLHAKTVVALDDQEAFGEAFAQAFVDEVKKEGSKVLDYEGVDPTANDYSAVLSKVASLKPDLLEFSGFYQPAGLLVKQARQMGIKSLFITDSAVYGDKYLGIAGKAAVGSYMTNVPISAGANTPLQKYLSDNLQSKYQIKVDGIDANAFDAVMAVSYAAQLAKSIAPADLIKVMHDVKFQGATGEISFLPDGDRAQVDYTVVVVTPEMTYKTLQEFKEVL
jgi:branched-chain amino acid transport system substrate-binding protein